VVVHILEQDRQNQLLVIRPRLSHLRLHQGAMLLDVLAIHAGNRNVGNVAAVIGRQIVAQNFEVARIDALCAAPTGTQAAFGIAGKFGGDPTNAADLESEPRDSLIWVGRRLSILGGGEQAGIGRTKFRRALWAWQSALAARELKSWMPKIKACHDLVAERRGACDCDHRLVGRGAAIAFYTVASIAPVLLIVIAIAGLVARFNQFERN
jgi:hypothetical protein